MPSVPSVPLPEHTATPVTRRDGRITAPPLVRTPWLIEHHGDVRVIDTRPAEQHAAAHVPGARSLPLDTLLVDDTSRPALRALASAVQRALAGRGIVPDDHVVLLDGGDGSASLGAVLCELAGCRRVSVVQDCGTTAWRAIGAAIETGPQPAAAADPDAWAQTEPRLGLVAAFEDLFDAVVSGTGHVVDARSQLEHEGIVGAPCCPSRGAIPGSVHLEWTAFLDMAGEPHGAERVAQIAAHVGLGREDRLIVTCHAGHRAAVAARVLRAAGFRDVRVALGSWHEWTSRGLGPDEAALA